MANRSVSENFVDLEIRIFQRQHKGYPMEITLGAEQEFPRGHLTADIVPWVSSGDLTADGQRLFEALVADSVLQRAWSEARGQAAQRRIRLRIDPTAAELHALPWELLREGPAMLSAQESTPFSRYLPIALPWGGLVEERPIRVLTVISDPDDIEARYGLPQADVARERATLESAFATVDPSDLQTDFLDAPVTLERLEEKLRDGYHILHYLGHGAFSDRRGQAVLYMQDEEGLTRLVFDDELAQLLARQGVRPRLVFLAACQSATRSTADAFLGMAPKLVSVGVPAVVAMQDFVTVESALKFGATFYQRLLKHSQVDLAVNEARGSLLTAGRADAAVPVLFMRLKSGQLWEREAKPEFSPPPEPSRPPEVTDFVGREAELKYFADKLAMSHLAVITGMPGMGKTAVASVLARHVSDPQKIFWHTFDDGESIAEVIWKLAGFLAWHGQVELWRMLHSTPQSGSPPPSAVLFDYLFEMLRGQGYLLCLDDFHFVDDDPLLGDFLNRVRPALRTGDLALIITSERRPSFVQADEFKVLGGLSLEDTIKLFVYHGLSVPQPQEGQSKIYGTQSLTRMDSLTSTDFVANLHARTGGNVHLLTLAVNTLKHTSNFLRVLLGLSQNDDIERFLTKEVDDNLTDDERAVMSAVAVLLGDPGTRGAIEAILEGKNVRRTLSDLSQRHLLNVSDGKTGREYSINPIMRHFYYDLLSKGERQAMHRRAAEYYEAEEPDESKAARHLELAGRQKRPTQSATTDIWTLVNRKVKSA